MQKIIRILGYIATVAFLYFFKESISYLLKLVNDLVAQNDIDYTIEFAICIVVDIIVGFIMLATIELDIWLEDRTRRKRNEKTYTEYMAQLDNDND